VATGCQATVTPEPFVYEPLRTSQSLVGRFRDHLAAAGVAEDPPPPRPPLASSDAGNVSQVVPTIHPWIGILPPGTPDVPIHTREFRDAAATDHAMGRMRAAACALALTALDVLGEPEVLRAARAELAGSA
jgi:metal-dependent amidase/aminoacylase/carboxypeptidase family protein